MATEFALPTRIIQAKSGTVRASIHHYNKEQHLAASLALFAAVVLRNG